MSYGQTAVRRVEFSVRDPKSTFRKIYLENLWGDPESRSGPGSSRAATEALRVTLPIILSELKIKSMLDAPCGDLAWISEIPLPLERYVGVDLVPELIDDLKVKYQGQRREFLVKDLRTDPLPAVDLVFCRDCLIHLSEKDVFLALRNIRDSGSKYLMTTTYPEQTANRDIITSWFRPINLQKPPFSFPSPRKLVVEQSARGNNSSRAMGLWLISELPL
ncbi:MAG: class I SAM-dependent methyltransferase [Polyangia bacterium]